MSAYGRQETSQTLGDLVRSLEDGDPCPWCGCVLECAGSLRAVDGSLQREGAGATDEPLLRCPDCGSEICASVRAKAVTRRGPLGAAA